MNRILTALALLALSVTASAGSTASDAYFVKVDRETTTSIDPAGAWMGLQASWDATAASPGLTLATDRATGGLVAIVHGDLSGVGTVLGVDASGTQALVGVEPDEIDFFGGAEPLAGVEPDEIDVFGDCDPEGLRGVEPDEIDVRTAVTADGEVFEMASIYAAYVIVNVRFDRAGHETWEPTHALVNGHCL